MFPKARWVWAQYFIIDIQLFVSAERQHLSNRHILWFWSWRIVNNNPLKQRCLSSHHQHFYFPWCSPTHLFISKKNPLDYESWWNNISKILVHKHSRCSLAPMALKCLSIVLIVSWKSRDRKGKAGMNIHKSLLRSSFVAFHWTWFGI